MKKLLAFVLTLIFLSLSLVSCDISSIKEIIFGKDENQVEEKPSEGLDFKLNDDGASYSVRGIGVCEDVDVVIPSSYNGLPVTSIKRGAFDHCYALTSIVISKSVITMDESPFEGCLALEKIDVHKDNPAYKSIDGNLYSKDGTVLIKYAIGKKDTSFTIPNFVTSIGYRAFERAQYLENVEMPDSVNSVGDRAFSWCSSLKSVKLSNSIKAISNGMFNYCTSLTDVAIPDSVKSIGSSAFEACKSLSKIVIPDGVTIINNYTFSNCESLKSVNIPSSVTKIGAYAFSSCESLTKIVIPDSVERIDGFAFNYCSSLTVYCEANSKPHTWHVYWKPSEVPVVWGYTGE